ncbi:MAG TPA: Rrf2 family transcriptional regulator [Balneolales bacterium]|nr:Rrf2 family transcriptional regulator [Balneolales bacterium]
MNNTRFAIAIHILTLLAYTDAKWLPSEHIAGSININPAMARKEISNLQEYGLVENRAGKYGGSKLAKPAAEIRLSDIYKAVNPTPALGFLREGPNPNCPVGRQINKHMLELNKTTEIAIINELSRQTLADFCLHFW